MYTTIIYIYIYILVCISMLVSKSSFSSVPENILEPSVYLWGGKVVWPCQGMVVSIIVGHM